MSTLVNQKAPDFTAPAVMPDGSIKLDLSLSDYRGSYVVLLFYPLDFTFVCPSELIAHNNRLVKFAELGVQLLGVSIDSQFTHLAWRETPVEQGDRTDPLSSRRRRESRHRQSLRHRAPRWSCFTCFFLDRPPRHGAASGGK